MVEWTSELQQQVERQRKGVIGRTGLIAGTQVATAMGWRPVEALAPGDKVLTFDHGMIPVQKVQRHTLWPGAAKVPEVGRPVHVPARALHNLGVLNLLPDQPVMVDSDAAMDALGDPFAIVKASALVGLRGIRRMPFSGEIATVSLRFESDQVIYAQGGLLAYCPCPHAERAAGSESAYEVLNPEDAANLVSCMAMEDSQQVAV